MHRPSRMTRPFFYAFLAVSSLGLVAACRENVREPTGEAVSAGAENVGEYVEEPFEEIDEHTGPDRTEDEDDFAPD